jgi:predicted dehydrogenase
MWSRVNSARALEQHSSSSRLGVALLGITHPHASGRLKALLADPTVEVLGAADDHDVIEPFTRHFALERRTADAILADPNVDAVLIHAKSEEMATLGAEALRAGKAVLVEKPGGRTLADLELLADAAERTTGVCQVGYTYRFSQAVAFTERVLAGGLLGDVVQVRAHGACSLDEAASSHINQPGDMGGAFWVIGSHIVDLVLHHFGVPATVNARVPKFPGLFDSSYGEDAGAATLLYERMLVSLDFMSWDPLPWIEGWDISVYGTRGVLHTCPLPARCDVFLAEPAGDLPAGWTRWQQESFPIAWAATQTEYSPELAEIANSELFEREVAAFLDAVRGDAPVAATATDARDVAHVIDACYESSRHDGRAVPIVDKSARKAADVQDLAR